MKKLSTLVCVLLAGGFVHAQNGVPMKSPAMVNLKKTAVMEKKEATASSSSANRAVIWSDDFGTNPTSVWTRTNASNPTLDWQFGSSLPTTLVNQGFDATINSTSGGAFAYIDSDGAGGTATQDASLTTTAAINLTSVAACQLTFTNYHRRFLETHTVRVSTDGGTTWTDFVVNSQYPTSTTSPNGEIVNVNIGCVAAGQANVKVSFRYEGAWDWFWAIDDVKIEDAPNDEVAFVSGGFYTASLNIFGSYPRLTIFPTTEIEPMGHAVVMQNSGANNQTNARIVATVLNSANAVQYTGMGVGQALGSCSASTLTDSVTAYTPAAVQGSYKNIVSFTYANIANDDNIANNADTFYHWIDNNLMAQDDNTYRGNGLWNGETGGVSDPFVIGNAFDMNSNQTLYSIDVALTGNSDAGVLLCGQLYQVDASTGDFNLVDETCGGAAEITVAAGDISSGGTITWVHNVFPAPIALTANETYIAAVNHYGGNEALVVMQGGTGAAPQTVFLLDGTDATWYYMTSIPMVRMNFDASIGVNEVAAAGNLELFQNVPNPANGTTRISFNLLENADVNFELVDVTGKLVMSTQLGNKVMGNHTMTIDVTSFATGVYYYSVIANGSRMTKKMVITE